MQVSGKININKKRKKITAHVRHLYKKEFRVIEKIYVVLNTSITSLFLKKSPLTTLKSPLCFTAIKP